MSIRTWIFQLVRLVFLLSLTLATNAAHSRGLKLYISADMEGVAGVVGPEQLGPKGFEYSQFRELMTAEVNTVIEVARESGFSEIVVSDSHGNGQNLLLNALPQDIELVRSWPRPLGMMEGIDDTFDAAILIGYHAGADSIRGIAAHTQSSANFFSLKINGIAMSEGHISALIAGHYGVPVVMISGDDVAVQEVSEMLGPIEGAVVKRHHSYSSGRTLMPEAAKALIAEKVRAGLGRWQEFKPFEIDGSLILDLTYKDRDAAEMISYLPNVELTDASTVRFVGSIVEISMFLEMALGYPSTINR